jgi:hypothetical protein
VKQESGRVGFNADNASSSARRNKWYYELPNMPNSVQQLWSKITSTPGLANKNKMKSVLQQSYFESGTHRSSMFLVVYTSCQQLFGNIAIRCQVRVPV